MGLECQIQSTRAHEARFNLFNRRCFAVTSKGSRDETAAQALVAQLRTYGVEHVFCVPGESYLAVLDALIDSGITVTVCRHEGGAAMMADAVGRRTGRPGVAFVTRAPGAANAATTTARCSLATNTSRTEPITARLVPSTPCSAKV